jgi:hypothetical protein
MTTIKHIGTPRHSGRYPWGSGGDPEQRSPSFLGQVHALRKQGLSEVEIATGFGMKTSELRKRESLAKADKRAADFATALRLKDKGYSNVAIGKRMNRNESSIRSLLDPVLKERADVISNTAKLLEEGIKKQGPIDIGSGVETHLGIARTKLGTAVALLEEKGYTVKYIKIPQVGTGKFTSMKVLAPPGMEYPEIYKNRDKISMVNAHVTDDGTTAYGLKPIQNVDSKRILIRYAEDGGTQKDGVIELRRNVDDLSLGNSRYAQVRVGVDGVHYMKGMAMYTDSIPNGVDIIYNTSKPKGTGNDKVFKIMEDDPDNPFGSTIKPGGQKGALNIVNEEGDWKTWSKNISSQILSKQNTGFAKKQLDLAYDLKKEEFDEIMSLTNPAVKSALLKPFADSADSAAVHLKAAALPRQMSQVILPISGIKENEIYAPNFRHGENVVLIRHPHGGTFEIPELIVNNRNVEARSLIERAADAVGIHPKVAERLSGADFDGDTVIVIPNKHGLIKTTSPLVGLKNFDHKTMYKKYDGMEVMDDKTKQLKMGEISNLITDMTIKGGKPEEIARAIRHSMVVIDAPKHELNYKQSYIDNNIKGLRETYQGGAKSGAATLVSRAKSPVFVKERRDKLLIDPKTGKKIYEETENSYVNKEGKIVFRKTKSTKMAETENAFTLSSGTPMERIYADHANALKNLANRARKEIVKINPTQYSESARKTYENEVASLKSKLSLAFRNKPLERQAQLLANKVINTKRKANPGIDAPDLKKIKGQALTEARRRVGSGKQKISILDREWEAIQAGAVSNNTLMQILLNTDLKKLKQRAMPHGTNVLSSVRRSRAKDLYNRGYTLSEIADAIGVSITTIETALK